MRTPLLPAPLLAVILLTPIPVLSQGISTVLSTVTTGSAPAATASASSQYTSDSDFQSAMLDAHNFYRTEHNASALTWNSTSTTYASNWANGCAFKHSGGPTGENLASGYANATASVDAWAGERSQYDFSAAQFSEATGHFTQVVWKATTSVGCGRTNCNGKGGTTGWYVVCEYYPPGNVVGEFAQNVQAQVKGPRDGDVEQGLGGAGALGVPWRELVTVLFGAVGVAMVLW